MPRKAKRKSTNQYGRKGKKGGMAIMMMGATGAVVGAALGTAAGFALNNAKTRQQLTGAMEDFSGQASDAFSDIRQRTNTMYNRGSKGGQSKRRKTSPSSRKRSSK